MVMAALAAGLLAGAAGAAVHAQEPPAPGATPAPAPIPVDPREPGRLPDGRYSASYVHYRVHSPRIAVRMDDPAGGPAWAVRVFDAERLTLRSPSRSLAKAHVIGRSRCVQLGRVQGSDFGWIFGDGRFHRTGIEDQLLQCTSRKRPKAIAKLASLMAVSDPAAPKLTQTLVWGYLPGASSAVVEGSGAADGAATVAGGAFLRLAGPDAHPRDASVSGGGKRVRFGNLGLPSRLPRGIEFPTIIPGTETIEAPAPDPAGGPRWGIAVAQTKEGTPCTSGGATQVVEGRGGYPDLRLALFTEGSMGAMSCRPLQTKPSAARPCDIGWGGGNAEELEGRDAFLAQARVERRLLAGRTMIYAQCSADVERVTLRTPRDVRTLVPSPIGHAILAVYDGTFVDGDFDLTAHLRGGKTWHQRQPLGGF
jgi:hypothetical protein